MNTNYVFLTSGECYESMIKELNNFVSLENVKINDLSIDKTGDKVIIAAWYEYQ